MTTPSAAGSAYPRTRRRRRWPIVVLIVLVVLVVLFVLVDLLARNFVEDRIGQRVDNREQTDGTSVDIHGFPFLTQVARNRFGEVDVSVPTIDRTSARGSVQLDGVTITLHDVRTSDTYTRATADSATGSAVIPYASLNRNGVVEFSYGGESDDGSGLLLLGVPALGGAGIAVDPSVSDRHELDLRGLDEKVAALPAPLRTYIDLPHVFDGLPRGIRVVEVEATEDGLAVTLEATDIQITR